MAQDAPPAVEGHERRLGEARHPFLERAHAVGEDLGQHGDHPPRQVDAVAALLRLVVERRARPHEVSHVGDVHAEGPLVGARVMADRDGVVEVLGVRRIDREREKVSQVVAVGPGAPRLGLEGPVRLAGSLDDGVGELRPQAVGRDDRLGLHVRLARLAEHPGDDPLGDVPVIRVVHELDHDLVAGPRPSGALGVRVADEHGLVEHPAVGLDEPLPAALEEHTNEVVPPPLEHLEDAAGEGAAARPAPAAPALADHLRPHAVAGDGVAGAAGRHEEITLPAGVLGNDEPEAPRGEPEHSLHLLAVARQGDQLIAGDVDSPLLAELIDRLLEHRAVLRIGPQLPRDRLARGRLVVGMGEVLEDSMGETQGHGGSSDPLRISATTVVAAVKQGKPGGLCSRSRATLCPTRRPSGPQRDRRA